MEDPDLEWVQIKPKMVEDQWNVYRRPLSLVCTIGLFIIGLTEAIVLLWHRGTWGFQEWIHEATFYNFWNGTYIVISASILLMLTCALGYYAIVKRSICWLIVVCVLHGATIFLNLVGSIAMFADAFATKEIWLARMIIDMIDPTNYNNNSIKDEFLGNIYRIVECCGADGYKDYTDRFDMSPHQECSDHRHSGGIYYEEGCASKFLVWLKAWAGCVLVLCLIVTLVQLQLMYWSKQLLRILKRQHRSAKKSKVEGEKLLSGVSGTTTVAKGIIKESKSQDNLQVPNVPVRSTSQVTNGTTLPSMVQNQVWVPAIQAIPVMFANGQVMMQTTQNQVPQQQNSMNFHNMVNDAQGLGYEKPLPKITDFQRQFRGNDEMMMRKKSLELEEQQATIDLSSENDSKLGKSIENEMKYRPQFQSPKSPKKVKKGSENRSGSSQKSHQTESTFAIDGTKSHEFSWRITESPNLPPRNSSNSFDQKNRENEKTHLYEPINYDLASKNQQKSPSEIKQLYREIRPGRLQEGSSSQNSKTQKSSLTSQTSKNSQNAMRFNESNESKNTRFEELQNVKQQNLVSSMSSPSTTNSSQNSKTQKSSLNSQTSKNSKTARFSESQNTKQQNWVSPSTTTSSSQNSGNQRFEKSVPTTKNSQNSQSVRFDESQETTQNSMELQSTMITKSSRNTRFDSSFQNSKLEKSSQNSRFQNSPTTTSGSTGYPHSTIESPTIPQPGTTNRGQSSGYVNIPMPFQVHQEKSSTLDRTREWVTSQESLIPKPLPPKPNLVPIEPINSIPYGYENVLPISQRFKEQPYSILSNMSNTNETCTTLTSDDDESEYLTRGDLTNNLKFAIKQRTIIEEDDPNSYRKKLTPETSI